MDKLFKFFEWAMLLLAACGAVAQAYNRSLVGFIMFMMLTFIIIRLMRLERK